MTDCAEPNRAACPRLCSDFCNAKEEAEARRSAADCSARVHSTMEIRHGLISSREGWVSAFDHDILRADYNRLLECLQKLMPFVLEDYYPNCATPAYRTAVESAKMYLPNETSGATELKR